MSKYAEVKVSISSRVLVEVHDDETLEEAIQYALDEFSGANGDITASCSN